MRRGGGVVPPGAAGLVVLAVAAVPIVVKHFRPIIRRVGKGLVRAGERVQKMADEVEGYRTPRQERESNMNQQSDATNAGQPSEAAETPHHSTASPTSQPEVEAQKTQEPAASAEGGAPKRRGRKPMEGATPPAVNPKRARKKTE
jgi:hypothetical protein